MTTFKVTDSHSRSVLGVNFLGTGAGKHRLGRKDAKTVLQLLRENPKRTESTK